MKDNQFEGKPCKHGHTVYYIQSKQCVECSKARQKRFDAKHPGRKEESRRKYLKTAKGAAANKATQKRYRENHLDEYREYQREYHKKWASENKDKTKVYYDKFMAKQRKENEQ